MEVVCECFVIWELICWFVWFDMLLCCCEDVWFDVVVWELGWMVVKL